MYTVKLSSSINLKEEEGGFFESTVIPSYREPLGGRGVEIADDDTIIISRIREHREEVTTDRRTDVC